MTQHVTWLSFSELQDNSVLVLIATIIIALVIWLVDTAFNNALNLFYTTF
jgi:preprotein translocase subunit SecE